VVLLLNLGILAISYDKQIIKIKNKAVCLDFEKETGFQNSGQGYPQNRWPGLSKMTLLKIIIRITKLG
jgi:hypothetical protein